MEVFSVFATLSLKDLLSGPLKAIRSSLNATGGSVLTLGQRMGNLALAMAPVAIASGAVVAGIGKCVSVAAGFEDQMAKVGAISNASSEDMEALEATARDLGATTQFTASQVAQGEQYLAMAGFKTHETIAALPGVLNLAAATAMDLGRAADISSDILGAFGMKADEMGRCADVLAKTCSTANTNMELLGDTMKYVAPVARTAGLSIEETAAMAGLLGNVGIKGSQAGTTLKAMLNKMAAPAKDAQQVFQKLGITVKDQAGNLRSPIEILGEMAGKLEKMGTAEQMAAMKAVVGEEAVAGFAELIKQGGIGEIKKYVEVLKNSGGACQEMADRMNDTLAGSVRSLGSAWESLQITIGKIFIPVVRKVVDFFTGLIRVFDKLAGSKVGKFILQVAGYLATAAIGITAFAAGFALIGKAMSFITGALGSVKVALLGLGAPVWIIIGVVALLYTAWKNNFGGIATVIARWYRNIKLVFEGVCAVFDTLKGSSGEIRGELAKEIKAHGLVKFVTTVGKIAYRIKEFFAGIAKGININGVINAFMPAINKLRGVLDTIGSIFAKVFGTQVTSAASSVRGFGETIGAILTKALEGLAVALNIVASGISTAINLFKWIIALFTGDFAGACEAAKSIWQNLCDSFNSILNFLGIKDLVIGAVQSIYDFFANFSVVDFFVGAWNDVTSFFSGISLFESGAKLLSTLKDGVLSYADSLIDCVSGVFSRIREFLPFSDAKTGPLSDLTLSGSRIMTTLGEGVKQGQEELTSSVSAALGNVEREITSLNPELQIGYSASPFDAPEQYFSPAFAGINAPDIPRAVIPNPLASEPELPPVRTPPPPSSFEEGDERRSIGAKESHSYTISIQSVILEGVQTPEEFVSALTTHLQGQITQLEGA
ncbi:MAG: phage tail tape measure protein [Desulfovibrio sp.]|nr:phage tail tape measure protein [Desulfovibrio sp.]